MSNKNKVVLIPIGIVAILFAFLQNGANLVSPLMAAIIADFPDQAPASVLLIQTLPSLGMVIGSICYGLTSRVFSSRRILVVASLIYVTASTAPILLGHLLVQILVARLCMGISCGIFAAMSVALIAANLDERRSASYMGYLIFAQSVALIVFQTGAGILGAEDWRVALLLGLLCLPIMVIGLAVLPKTDTRADKNMGTTEKVVPPARKEEIKVIPFLSKYPPIYFAWCIEAFFFMAGVFVLFVNTSIMIEAAGYGGTLDAVLVLNAHTVSGLVFSLLFGKMYARFKEFMLFIASVVAVLAFACFVFAQDITLMCAGAAMLGFSVPTFLATLYQLIGKRINALVSATATSVLVAFQQLGGLLMVYFVQPLCDIFALDFAGGRDAFLVYCGIYTLIAIAVLIQALVTWRKVLR
jgi:MFS family permease